MVGDRPERGLQEARREHPEVAVTKTAISKVSYESISHYIGRKGFRAEYNDADWKMDAQVAEWIAEIGKDSGVVLDEQLA